MAKASGSGSMAFDPRPFPSSLAPWGLTTWMYRNSRAVHPERNLLGLAQRAQLFVRQLARRRELRRWHRAVASPLHDMLAWRPSLVSVVRRPYVNSGWTAARRVAAVGDHYRQLEGRARAFRLAPQSALRLATLTVPGSTVEIVLDAPAWFVHEGELCLNLFHAGERVYTLAFSLGSDGGEPVAHVGALQGSSADGALDLYRTLTSACHGLRPRDLLISAFRIVCRELGLARWLAVCDRSRVCCNPYFGTAMPVHTSYDAVWSEHGGLLRKDGFYRMPIDVARRSRDAIPTRKRSSYRQRYELLDRLDADLRQAIGARGAS